MDTGEIPETGKKGGRPPRPVTEQEREIIKKSYKKYRVSASTLEKLIERDYGVHVPHNHIHKILLSLGLAKPKLKKDVRKKKWKRYERKHSLTAVHLDWFYDHIKEQQMLPVIDDASRKLLSLIETKKATKKASIEAMKQALNHGKIKQCNIRPWNTIHQIYRNSPIHKIPRKIQHKTHPMQIQTSTK